MTRHPSHDTASPDTISLDPRDRVRIGWNLIVATSSIIVTLAAATAILASAAYRVSGDIQDVRLTIEGRMSKIETLVGEHDRRIGHVEGRLSGGKP